jgi:glycosyltransferase involved in cell wall biosynthesis
MSKLTDRPKILTVVTEVFISQDGTQTVSRAFNARINEYSMHFDRINIVAPSIREHKFTHGVNKKIYYYSTSVYSKDLWGRLRYFFKHRFMEEFFHDAIMLGQPDLVEIRIPSLFSLRAYYSIKKLNIPMVAYIAGDWGEAFRANNKFIGSRFVSRLLDLSQNSIIKNTIPVSAGSALAEKYANLNQVYPYFSTTHREVNVVNKEGDVINLLFVGRLESGKCVEDAIKALKITLQQYKSVFLHIVGDGPRRSNLEKLSASLGVSDSLRFYGYISDVSTLNQLYKKSHIFIFPSISEGSPKVLGEAMSFGVIPIAVKNVGSIDRIISDGENGFLVPKHSPGDIAEIILSLIGSKDIQISCRQKCYVYASEHTIGNEVKSMWSHVFRKLAKNEDRPNY